jgi:trehalose synthase
MFGVVSYGRGTRLQLTLVPAKPLHHSAQQARLRQALARDERARHAGTIVTKKVGHPVSRDLGLSLLRPTSPHTYLKSRRVEIQVVVVTLERVAISALSPDLLRHDIGDERLERLHASAAKLGKALGAGMVLNVNSTATGGGVAEMLHTLLGYARGAGLDVRWMVLDAPPEFFVLTKRLHHMLHGVDPGGAIDDGYRRQYEQTLKVQAVELRTVVRPGDIVVLHDPQTAGLAPALLSWGAHVVWRCHVGTTSANATSERGWQFLRPYLKGVPIVVTQRAYLPSWVDRELTTEIPPSIDPLSTKNMELTPSFTRQILQTVGLVSSSGTPSQTLTFVRRDGTPGRVERLADILQSGPPPPIDAQLIVQISRWDPLKDMAGVMTAFAEFIAPNNDSHLLLAGPNVTAVADDPEAVEVLRQCMAQWGRLPASVRSRVHLACLAIQDVDENGLLVNALQRAATVVVQKSLAEGFGLTVTEAMWKSKPVVASRVGGIPAQIVSGETGWLIDDPGNHDAFAAAVCSLLKDPVLAGRLGDRARTSVAERFLPDRHLTQWSELLQRLLQPSVPTV